VCDYDREIFVVWDDCDKKVYYTDTDLEDLAQEQSLMEFSKSQIRQNGQPTQIKWKEYVQGYPFYAHGKWYHFFTRYNKEKKKHEAIDISPDKVKEDSRKGGYLIRAGRFIAHMDTHPEGPLPETLVWKIHVPTTPTIPFFSKEKNGYVLDERLLYVQDLKGVIFLRDEVLRENLVWDGSTSSWQKYSVRDPGVGPFFGRKFQRAGVVFEGDVGTFFWRDPLTQILYALVPDQCYLTPQN
jgi:hypothetical protein